MPLVIVARNERRVDVAMASAARHDDLAPANLGGIALRAYQHEIVVHDRIAPDALPLREKNLLGSARVHENHVGVAAASDIQGLPGAHRDDMDLHTRLPLIDGKQVAEQARLLGGVVEQP